MTPAPSLPQHIAIVMDGNGRWAKKRLLPRVAGHKVGVETVRCIVEQCVKKGIKALTLFAFSSENWQRPDQEVGYLMNLFLTSLQRETRKLHEQAIQIQFIGDRSRLNEKLLAHITESEQLTKDNQGLKLVIAVNYGGQWDILQAMQKIAIDIELGQLSRHDITTELIQAKLVTAGLPEPDLFIRTSGEQRISNFLLWQLAYTELYFTDVLWPDFDEKEFDNALAFFTSRQRRFGYTGEQIEAN